MTRNTPQLSDPGAWPSDQLRDEVAFAISEIGRLRREDREIAFALEIQRLRAELDEMRKPATEDELVEVGARLLIDADPSMSGHCAEHLAVKRPAARAALAAIAPRIRAAERERCARIAESKGFDFVAAAIRSSDQPAGGGDGR